MKKLANFGMIVLILFLITTDTFKDIINYFLNSDRFIDLPDYWIENRMILIAGTIILVTIYYLPVLKIYIDQFKLYRSTSASIIKPELSSGEAAYILDQSKTSQFSNWIIEMCQLGTITLLYDYGTSRFATKALHPWSIRKTQNTLELSDIDKRVMNRLFSKQKTIRLEASFDAPHKDVSAAAEHLIQAIDKKISIY